MKKILIHIGFGKTASTLFQQHLFSNHKDINYLGGVRFENYKSKEAVNKNTYILFRAILSQDSLNFDNEHWSKFYKENIYTKLSDKKLNVFSEEWLTYTPLTLVSGDRGLVAQRLYDIFGKYVNILVFLRNQNNVLNSIYNKHLHTLLPLYSRDNSWRSNQIIDKIAYHKLLIQTEDYGILSKYKYYKLIHKYKTLFDEGLIVKLYEDFSNDYRVFLKELASDLDISFESFLEAYPSQKIKGSTKRKENTSLLINKLLFKRNKIANSKDIFSGNFIGTQRMSNIETEKYIKNYFKEDNYKLDKLISVNLKKYGYPSK